MSLLLDALKKAAEKKAQKNAEDAGSENVEAQVSDENSGAEATQTLLDQTASITQTEVEATQLDDTHPETIKLDHTDDEQTELDELQLGGDSGAETQFDKTHPDFDADDVTEVDATQLDSTQVDLEDNTELDATHVEAHEETELDVTQLDSNEVTELDATQLDSTQVDLEDNTELNATHVEAHEESELDVTQLEMEDKTELDSTQVEFQSEPEVVDETQITSSEHGQDLSPGLEQDVVDDEDVSAFTSEDETLYINDDVQAETITNDTDATASQTDLTEDDPDHDETLVLTPDDVTEFLGDQDFRDMQSTVTARDVDPYQFVAVDSDDTTMTNPDAVSLKDIINDDSESDDTRLELTQSDTFSVVDYEGELPPSDEDEIRPIADEEKSTLVNADATSTSTVDIETLTNDETVTVKDSSATRTFAPDNYDRTLLKLSDNDVSRIFPGMKSETDAVMTPDYAKKVFQTKSHGVKSHYYKIYAGVASLILLVVSLWGLFHIQQESETIDSALRPLKRDPLPGVIKNQQEEATQLFAEGSGQVDNKALEIIATADQDPEVSEAMDSPEQSVSSTESVSELPLSSESEDSSQLVMSEDTVQPEQQTERVKPAPKALRSVDSQQAQNAETSAIEISSSNRLSDKDQLLASAYESYESGRLMDARRQYDQVISIDPENRDALLGRAAIHVMENDFQNAIRLYQQLLLQNPKDDLAMTSLISIANIDPQSGETEVKRMLNESPDSPYLHFALGNMYGNQQRWPEAQSAYFKALQYKPEDPNYAYNLAVSLEHLQQPETAITFYQRALDNRNNALVTFSDELVAQRIEVLNQ